MVFAGSFIENVDGSFLARDAEPVFPAAAEFGDHCSYEAEAAAWFAISAGS